MSTKSIANTGNSITSTFSIPSTSQDREVAVFNGTTGTSIVGGHIKVSSEGDVSLVQSVSIVPIGANPGNSSTLWSNASDGNKLYWGSSSLAGSVGTPGTSTVGSLALWGNTSGSTLTSSNVVLTEPRNGAFTLTSGGFCNVRVSLDDRELDDPGPMHIMFSTTTQDNQYCVAIGDNTLQNAVGNFGDIAIGSGAMRDYIGTDSYFNIAIGVGAMGGYGVTGQNCIIMGSNTFNNSSGIGTVAIGHGAGQSITSDTNSVYLGAETAKSFTGTCSNNIIIGYDASESNTTNSIKIGNGSQTELRIGNMASYTYSAGNCAFGSTINTSGNSNSAVGSAALSSLTTGSSNTAIGNQAMDDVTTGNFNTGVGVSSLRFATEGSGNTCLGWYSGANYTTTETNNILIGYYQRGVVGESNTIRLGTDQTKSFIAGVRGVTTTNADAIPVVIDSSGQSGTVSSSRKYKTNIEPILDSDILMKLKPMAFDYVNQNAGFPQLGLIAEEVEEVYPDMVIYQDDEILTVDYQRLCILLLHRVQQLSREFLQ